MSTNYDGRFYPFTEIHPFKPWYQRIKVLVLGESATELRQRLHVRDVAWANMMPITLGQVAQSGSMTPNIVSGSITPSIGQIGLGMRSVSGNPFMEWIEAGTSYRNVAEKLFSVPPTPKIVPEFEGGASSWSENLSETFTNIVKSPTT
jgi:hypothetical protein